MFCVNDDGSIYITRGDIGVIELSANDQDGKEYIFQPGDIIRLRIFEKNRCDNVLFQKDVDVNESGTKVDISLVKDDTKLGDIINRPKDYWYEIELNPDTRPQTIIGYDSTGPKIFRIFPEGDDKS